MATDIQNTTLPNDNVNAPDTNFSNDTSLNGTEPSQMAYVEPSEGANELIAVDQAIIDGLYPNPEDDEFVVGRNFESGAIGINSRDLGIIVGHVSLPITPTISEMTQNVSGMYGQRWLGNNYGAKVFNIPVTVIATSADEYIKNVEQISNTLIQIGNTEVPLVFGAFPERTYYGHFTSIPEPAYIGQGAWDSTLTLQFTASDPHGYLASEVGSADNQNKLAITPLGNDTAKPIYQFNFTADSNNFGYVNSKGESVFVGYADNTNTQDLMPVVYREPFEDLATLTQVTNMNTQPFALANADVTTDGTMAMGSTSQSILNDKFWVAPKDYTGQATMFGNLLLTKKFNVGANGNYYMSTRLIHRRYYDRAYQRIETYLLSTDGHKIGRFGIQDYGSGGLTYIYILFGKTVAEEQANLANGFGYWGTGNTAWARAQLVDKHGYDVTLNTSISSNLTVDRRVTTDFTQVLYDAAWYDRSAGNKTAQYANKWVHTKQTTEEWKTPRDAKGKATGPQQYTTETKVDTLSKDWVRANRLDHGWNEPIAFETYQDIKKRNYVWGSSVGLTEYIETWHKVGTPNPGYGNGWKFKTTDHQYGKWVDDNSSRASEIGMVISEAREPDHNDSSALTDFWGSLKITKIDNTLKFNVAEIKGALETGNIVLDETFNIPKGFDAKLGQLGYYFGKAPIHEDKITKTTPAKDDKPASYEYVKSYSDDVLEVTDLWVTGITTADAIKKAHTIIHAGDSATIDVETENVYINGALANQYLSPASTYPSLKGGSQEQISFYPTADKASVKYTYRPAMK